MNCLVKDGVNTMCFSTSRPCELKRTHNKSKKLPKIIRKYNDNIKLLLRCHKIESELLCKVNNTFDKKGI